MPRRRRFGVSLPEELAEQLDTLSRIMGRDRSSLVAEALRTYIHDHLHLARSHRCAGVVIAWSRGSNGLNGALEDYMDIVKGHLHAHIGGYCVNILLVEGDSERIAGLARRLAARPGCVARYIPLGLGVEEGVRDENPGCTPRGESQSVLPAAEEHSRGAAKGSTPLRESSRRGQLHGQGG